MTDKLRAPGAGGPIRLFLFGTALAFPFLLALALWLSILILPVNSDAPPNQSRFLLPPFAGSVNWSLTSDLLNLALGVPVALVGSLVAIALAHKAYTLSRYQAEADWLKSMDEAAKGASEAFWGISQGLRDVMRCGTEVSRLTARLLHRAQGKGKTGTMRALIRAALVPQDERARVAAERDLADLRTEHVALADAVASLSRAVAAALRSPAAMDIVSKGFVDNLPVLVRQDIHRALAMADGWSGAQFRLLAVADPARRAWKLAASANETGSGKDDAAISPPLQHGFDQVVEGAAWINDIITLLDASEADLRRAAEASAEALLMRAYMAIQATDLAYDLESEAVFHTSGTPRRGGVERSPALPRPLVHDMVVRASPQQVAVLSAKHRAPFYMPSRNSNVPGHRWNLTALGFLLLRDARGSGMRIRSSVPFDEHAIKRFQLNLGVIALAMVSAILPREAAIAEPFFVAVQRVYGLAPEATAMREKAAASIRAYNIHRFLPDRLRDAFSELGAFAIVLPRPPTPGASHELN